METSNELGLTQMKRSVQKLGCSAEGFGDLTLMRFLIARSMDPEKAAQMFVQWFNWRHSFVPSGFVDESEVADELEHRKVCLQGLTKNGYPLMIVLGSKHRPPKDHTQFKKFVVYLLDKTLSSSFRGSEAGNEKMMGIIDVQGISYKNVDLRGLITAFQFLQSYYPERLAKAFVVNMTPFFVRVWRIVARFLDKATLEKIVIVGSEDEKKQLIDEVGVDILPEMYGGKAKFIAIQDFKLAPHQEVTHCSN
uniref:CRAL-TRIO domain-containing protein n=1 Tax=Kalanchoe fedtschenkoi TaxID=63787 RepID=A0A7N0TCN8_KALFE